jgi:hypothetical protein
MDDITTQVKDDIPSGESIQTEPEDSDSISRMLTC